MTDSAKLKEMETAINKIENMLTESKLELKHLEVEWFHLKGLVNETEDSKIINTAKPIKKEILNEINEINSERLNLETLQPYKEIFSVSNAKNQLENSPTKQLEKKHKIIKPVQNCLDDIGKINSEQLSTQYRFENESTDDE